MSIDPFADKRHMIEVASDLIEFFAENNVGRSRPASEVKHLRPNECFPRSICLEIGALVLLAQLESSGLSGLSEPLPSVKDAIASLKARLSTNPSSFWTNDSQAEELFGRAFKRWSTFSWQRFDSANIAVALDESNEFVEALVDLLWTYRHLAPPADCAAEQPVTPRPKGSLFDSMPRTTKKGTKNRGTCLPPTPASTGPLACFFS